MVLTNIFYICVILISIYLYVSKINEPKIIVALIKLLSIFTLVISLIKLFWPIIIADYLQTN